MFVSVNKIQTRWRLLRNNYKKTIDSIKDHLAEPETKKVKVFPFFERLRFLDKLQDFRIPSTIKLDNIFSIEKDVSNLTLDCVNYDIITIKSVSGSEDEIEKQIKTKYCDEYELKSRVTEMLKNNSHNQTKDDPDVAYFNSVLPMVRQMTDYEKLIFRSNVMNELLKYTNK